MNNNCSGFIEVTRTKTFSIKQDSIRSTRYENCLLVPASPALVKLKIGTNKEWPNCDMPPFFLVLNGIVYTLVEEIYIRID